MNDELVNEIERLNLEIIMLEQSKEYRIGKKILHLKNLIKKGSIREIAHKIINTKKMNKMISGQFKDNFDYSYLKKSVNLTNSNKKKIIVYTCITGDYDEPSKIYLKEDCCDYVLFTNNKAIKSNEWKVEYIPEDLIKKYNNKELNRYYKMHPFMLNEKYDYAIYVDGNIDIISKLSDLTDKIDKNIGIALHKHKDNNCVYEEAMLCEKLKKGNLDNIRKTIEKYREEKMPEQYGLAECCLIVTNLENGLAKKIFENWWDLLISSNCERDQIILPYVLWKNGIKTNYITTLGNNVYRNPKIRMRQHK